MSVLNDLGRCRGLSTYRACQHQDAAGNVHWVIEANHIEIVCVAADEAAAYAFAKALNETEQNTDV